MTVIYCVLCAAIGLLGGMFLTARAIAEDCAEEMKKEEKDYE